MSIKNSHCFTLSHISEVVKEEPGLKPVIYSFAFNNAK